MGPQNLTRLEMGNAKNRKTIDLKVLVPYNGVRRVREMLKGLYLGFVHVR